MQTLYSNCSNLGWGSGSTQGYSLGRKEGENGKDSRKPVALQYGLNDVKKIITKMIAQKDHEHAKNVTQMALVDVVKQTKKGPKTEEYVHAM